MVDVMEMPVGSFGYVPTPALVAPVEFTLRSSDYAALGGYVEKVRPVADIGMTEVRKVTRAADGHDPTDAAHYRWSKS